MWIIKISRIGLLAQARPDAAAALERWASLCKRAQWRSLADVRLAFRSADEVRVASGRTAVVFNIAGNKYRLITAIHYNTTRVFILLFLTHAEYSKDRWKDTL